MFVLVDKPLRRPGLLPMHFVIYRFVVARVAFGKGYVGMADLRQIGNVRKRVKRFDDAVAPVRMILSHGANAALAVVGISEYDGFGGARLLAGCLYVDHVLKDAVFLFSLEFTVL